MKLALFLLAFTYCSLIPQSITENKSISTSYNIEDNDYKVIFVEQEELTEAQIIIIIMYVSKMESYESTLWADRPTRNSFS